MNKKNDNKIGLLKPEKKRVVVEAIIAYFDRERGEKIGVIAAEDIVDYLLELVGKEIYNRGVDDATKFVQERITATWVDVEATVKKDS